jgi:hypothetical protein
MLMLVAALPWLVRWHLPPESSPVNFAAVSPVSESADIEVLPPLYAKVSSSTAANAEGDSGATELLDGLIVPTPAGGLQ